MRRQHAAALGVPVVLTVALRLPVVVSRAVLGYDDGVYLASVSAMRAGGVPFRDVYSSQGPAFLPLLWLADVLSARPAWSARLVPLAAAVVLVVVVHRLVEPVAGVAHAVLAALLVATSGGLVLATWRVESDAVATAFGAGAVLCAARLPACLPARAGAVVGIGVLAGTAVAIKSLLVLPTIVAVAWLVGRRAGLRALVGTGAVAAGVVAALALVWGPVAVWEQSVALHLEARDASQRVVGGRWVELLGTYDRVLLGAAGVGLAAAAVRALRALRAGRAGRRPGGHPDLAVAAWLWLATACVVLVVHEPLFVQHLTVVVVPLALVTALLRPPLAAVAVAAALLVGAQGAAVGWRVTSPTATPDERAAAALLARVEPRSAPVVSDEPALVWLAGRVAPGPLVDPSFVRVEAGFLTAQDLREALDADGVCAVLFWSGRFDAVDGFGRTLDGYRSVHRDGDRELLLRDGCTLAEPRVARRR